MDIGRILREDRARRDETLARQARRLGISRSTLAELERGANVRLSTLAGLARALPSLTLSVLLDASSRVPPASRALTLALARIASVLVESLELSVRLEGAVLHREVTTVLRSRHLADPRLRVALLRAILPGHARDATALAAKLETSARAQLHAEGPWHEASLRGARLRHVVRSETPGAPGIVAHATSEEALASGLALGVSLPTRRLVLSFAGVPARAVVAPLAWLPPGDAEGASLETTHPVGVHETQRRGRARVVIEWPVVGMDVGACLVPRAGRRPVRRAHALAVARARAGLTLRDLARRAGVSSMAVSKIQRGADLRRDTAVALLVALPSLSAWSLVAPQRDVLAPEAAWQHGVELFGLVSAEEWKLVTIDAAGNASLRIGTRGLTRLRGDGPLRIGLGREPPGATPTRAKLSQVQAGRRARNFRVGSGVSADGERYLHLEIPGDVAGRAATFERVLRNSSVYTMTRARAFGDAPATDEPVFEGASMLPLLPCERMTLEVRWPRGWAPVNVRHHCWPTWQPPDPARPDIEGAPRAMLEVDERRRRILLRVRRPLIGTKHSLSWELP